MSRALSPATSPIGHPDRRWFIAQNTGNNKSTAAAKAANTSKGRGQKAGAVASKRAKTA